MMSAKSVDPAFKYVNVDSETLEITLTKKRRNGLVLPTDRNSSKMWEMVRFGVMYPAVYAADPKKGINVKYSLPDPPLWLTTIAAIMWEGVMQGAAWDTV